MKSFVECPTRFLFFTGKGGVGKTSLACATGLRLADQGKKVLLVSTDPASNLDEVLGVHLTSAPNAIPGGNGLLALNINPEEAARAYRERSIGPYRNVLPEQSVRDMEEQLSGACTVEIAAFDEFTSLLLDNAQTANFDHIIFDTAPTGHTLRLLSLPAAWTEFLNSTNHGASCLGPSSALKNQKERYATALETLRNSALTTIVLVARPERSAIAEAERTSRELREIGLLNQQVAMNSVFHAIDRDDKIALAFEARVNQSLQHLSPEFTDKITVRINLKPFNMVGIEHLRQFFVDVPANRPSTPTAEAELIALPLSKIVDQIEADGKGLVMVMGKGGVGKTTVASAIAIELASRGHSVHLTTTDPAAHLDATVSGSLADLKVDHIDPKVETQNYIDQVIRNTSKDLNKEGLELLREDLKSPCTEEVAVFGAFNRVVNEARRNFVVVDTAPTGHTLLLLDAAGSYHREVMRSFGKNADSAAHVATPLMRLKDPSYTKILIVTLAETTPVSEASALQDDLRRAEIEPFAWVVNQSFVSYRITDPVLAGRAQEQVEQIKRIENGLAKKVALVPWLLEAPVGVDHLRNLMQPPSPSRFSLLGPVSSR